MEEKKKEKKYFSPRTSSIHPTFPPTHPGSHKICKGQEPKNSPTPGGADPSVCGCVGGCARVRNNSLTEEIPDTLQKSVKVEEKSRLNVRLLGSSSRAGGASEFLLGPLAPAAL